MIFGSKISSNLIGSNCVILEPGPNLGKALYISFWLCTCSLQTGRRPRSGNVPFSEEQILERWRWSRQPLYKTNFAKLTVIIIVKQI